MVWKAAIAAIAGGGGGGSPCVNQFLIGLDLLFPILGDPSVPILFRCLGGMSTGGSLDLPQMI